MNGRGFWFRLPVAMAPAAAFARSGASADRRKLPGRFQMAALCRVAATLLLLAAGTIANPNIPFAPVLVLLPDARPVLSGLLVTNATARLTATNLAAGNGYTLERSADLAGWTNALSFTATNAAQDLTFPATNTPAQFFRLRSP